MSNPFDSYKDKVKYDYILRGKLPYNLKNGDFDQQGYAMSDIVKEIESLLENEDYIKDSFEEVGLGRVYPKLEVEDPTINILFGISKIDAESELDIEELKKDVEGFMEVLDSNIDGSYQTGIAYNDPEVDDIEPCTVYLKRDKNKPIEVEVVENEKVESINKTLEDIDKKLVSENKLIFRNNTNIKSLVLSDDGMIELYENEKLITSTPFSKLGLIRECKETIQEGYSLEEATINSDSGTSVDVDQSRKDLQQGIKDVDELQQLKDELQDKVNKLVNESTSEEITDSIFPSSEFTMKKLTPSEIVTIDLQSELTPEQIDYINNKMCKSENGFNNVEELEWYLKNDFANLFFPDLCNEPITSIDDYINGINKVRKEYNNE